MATFIATFFSHFGAVRFHRELKAQGIQGTMMPVPRRLSSSCGTCVQFEAPAQGSYASDDIEALFLLEEDGSYQELYSNL